MEQYILIAICLVFGGISLRLWYNNFSSRRQQRKRFKRGIKLEKKAESYLINQGFSILGEQLEYKHSYFVNSEETSSILTIDYLVEKNGRLYVVEVKSGKTAISIKNRSTRRQLLEYAVAIECEGVYLLDMENEELSLITFDFPNRAVSNSKDYRLVSFLILIIIALLIIVYYYIF